MQKIGHFYFHVFFALVAIALITAPSIKAEVSWANYSRIQLLAEVTNGFDGGEYGAVAAREYTSRGP